jgi:hypothetical protein
MTLTIDFFILGFKHPYLNAWFGGMYHSFFEALEEAGCHVTYSSQKPNMEADVLVVQMAGIQDRTNAQAMQAFKGPVVLNVGAADFWFRRDFLDRWRDRILFAYGPDNSQFSTTAFSEKGIKYYHLPFASSSAIMRPLETSKIFDVTFVGNAHSGTGRYQYFDTLFKKLADRKILLVGPGWERYGFPRQTIVWGELLNAVYNLSHVCINISNDNQKEGPTRRLDANNRLFDLAMAGCFQVSNAPQVVRQYFDEKQVVAVDPVDEWVETILHYLDHPEETEPYRLAARQRALAEHTWNHRAEKFLSMIELHLPEWKSSRKPGSLWTDAVRLRDTMLPPYGIVEAYAKARRKVKRTFKIS